MKHIFSLILAAVFAVSAAALSPEEIIKKMEDNQVHDTGKAVGSMTTTDKFGTIKRTFISYSKGSDESLIEFTSKEEAGQKILRTANEIYLYFPDAEELIRLQGAALRDSVMDSDFSYEDMTGEGGILDDYNVFLEQDAPIDGHDCYVIRMEAKRRSVPYQLQRIWVDKELFVYRQAYRYSKSGTLLKEMKITRIETIKGKHIPMDFVMSDKMKKDSKTVFSIEKLEIGIKLDDSIFSVDNLTW